MFTRTMMIAQLVLGLFCGATGFGQEKAAAPVSPEVREFPAVLQQSVTAGKTPVGTKVQAKLTVATLLDGAAFPRNAILSGKVIESTAESTAETATEPSRLAIRMDSVQGKNQIATMKVYLTAWYYPAVVAVGEDLQYGPPQPTSRTWNGQAQYPDPNSAGYKPFPGGRGSEDKQDAVPNTTAAITSNHRVLMKNAQSAHASDGAVVIGSLRTDIKLDRLTTYVFAANDSLPTKIGREFPIQISGNANFGRTRLFST